jgi:anti-sigma factor RsiW
MNIDRYNYEEYFLLYVDNELPVDQKKQVERFVKHNPDLEEELVMLQQSRLIPDNNIVFEGKELLMKENNNSLINSGNYEEWLVLYVDDELSNEERTRVEQFAALHAQVQAELNLFLQTKLQAEEVKFPNKELLYKRENKVRVISMTWWRVAAAILIIGAGITTYSVLNTKDNEAASGHVAERQLVKPKPTDQQSRQSDAAVSVEDKNQVAVINPRNVRSSREKLPQKQTTKESPDNLIAGSEIAADETKKRAEVISELNTLESNSEMNTASIQAKPQQIINESNVTNQVSETPDDYATNNENKRLRGIFRKATRFIERTSGINPANDDNRVLIGAVAVNLK